MMRQSSEPGVVSDAASLASAYSIVERARPLWSRSSRDKLIPLGPNLSGSSLPIARECDGGAGGGPGTLARGFQTPQA